MNRMFVKYLSVVTFVVAFFFIDVAAENIPKRVVSLSPSITEAIISIGAEENIVGMTYHRTPCPAVINKKIIGGFFSPDLNEISKLKPDMIFMTRIHEKIENELKKTGAQIVQMDDVSVAGFYENMIKLGQIFKKEKEAQQVIQKVKNEIGHIAKKTASIPQNKKLRAARILGREKIMLPADNTFHNEYVSLAGGIPLKTGQDKGFVEVTLEQWKNLNPQFLFYCESDQPVIDKYFSKPGWKDVDAVKNGKVVMFPCDLTCRTSTHAGYFTSWLSSSMYSDEFFKSGQIKKDSVNNREKLKIDLDYLDSALFYDMNLYDFESNAVILRFKKPQKIISTLEGPREKIKAIGNHYNPPPCWGMLHQGTEPVKNKLCDTVMLNPAETSLLYTGADTKNTSIKKGSFKDLTVYVLVTAGVSSNAMRSSKDEGAYYEHGTINMMILANRSLSNEAMSGIIITATEAKTAALQDLDIRSSYQPVKYQATGTGTDSIIVVQGEGKNIKFAGGHTKISDLISKAVYAGVKEAVFKQNGISESTDIFAKLKKRGIEIFSLGYKMSKDGEKGAFDIVSGFEKLLLDEKYESFLEAAFAISDDYEAGIIKDLTFFQKWCDAIADDIAGKKLSKKDHRQFVGNETAEVLKIALNAMLNGVFNRKK